MQTFTIRELRERSGDLSREAEEGRLALVTRHGKPLFVSVPFTDNLLQMGVHTALAVSSIQERRNHFRARSQAGAHESAAVPCGPERTGHRRCRLRSK